MRDDPSLRDIPIAVGGDPGRRGVIATCNYPARKFGIHSAMASALAKKRCPQLLILPGNFDKYREASRQIQTIFRRYTGLIEPLSLDEAFLDVSHCQQHSGSATRIAEAIRQQVRDEVGISISAGVAPNKFLAKIASDWNKPDGLCVIPPHQVERFVSDLPVAKIFGVGPATATKLQSRGVHTCADLRRLELEQLNAWLGRFGERLYQLSRGIDERPVRTERIRKSLSVEQTFTEDLPSLSSCKQAMPELLERLQRRLEQLPETVSISATSVKVKFSDFVQTTVEARSEGVASHSVLEALLEQGYRRGNRPVRLLGVGVKLGDQSCRDERQQLELFS